MEVTADTRVLELLDQYGDIAPVMEALGVRRAGPLGLRRVLARFLTVRRAAWVHGVPLEEFLLRLRVAVQRAERARENLPRS